MSRNGWDRAWSWEKALAARGLADGAGTDVTAWRKNELGALLSRHPFVDESDVRWHISVSGDGRLPAWDELVDAAHSLRPGVSFCLGVPPKTWWMNVHPHVLHMWETRDDGLIEEWRRNARGDRPT